MGTSITVLTILLLLCCYVSGKGQIKKSNIRKVVDSLTNSGQFMNLIEFLNEVEEQYGMMTHPYSSIIT